MAYLAEDDKQLDGQGQAQAGQGPAQLSEGSSIVGGGGGGSGAAATSSTAPPGGGGWTNIQSYLEANKGDNGTSQALSKDVGSAFDSEKSKLDADEQGKSALDQADSQVNAIKGAHQKARDYINSDNPADSPYTDVHSGLTNQFNAPQVSYNLGNQASEYGRQLQDDKGFDEALNQTYNKAAGGQMSSGQRALQYQLDVNNPGLAQARQNLTGQYKQLNDYLTGKKTATEQALADRAKQYGDEQAGIKTDLQNSYNGLDQQLASLKPTPPPTGPDAPEVKPSGPGFDSMYSKYKGIAQMLGVTPKEYSEPKYFDPMDTDQSGDVSDDEAMANTHWGTDPVTGLPAMLDNNTGLPWQPPKRFVYDTQK